MLKVGLLWFDDDPKRPVAAKLDEAVERYEERFGARPTLVYLHPAQAEGIRYQRVRLYGDASLRRNHFLVGADEAVEDPAPAGQETGATPPVSRTAGLLTGAIPTLAAVGVAAGAPSTQPGASRAAVLMPVPEVGAVRRTPAPRARKAAGETRQPRASRRAG